MKALRYLLAILIGVILLAGAFSGGILVGSALPGKLTSNVGLNPNTNTSSTGSSTDESPTDDVQDLFAPFWEAWNIVHDQYVDQPVDDVNMMRGAIEGMMESLGDEHSSYMDPEMYNYQNENLNGQEYEGIGAWVDLSGDYPIIISPMQGAPADKAGLKPKDMIVAIDGKDIKGLPGEEALNLIMGPEGTKVTLTIQRGEENPETFDVEVTREKIITPTVTGKMLDDQIAYVELFTFGDTTDDDLDKILKDLMSQNPDGMILDLRNNGGGYLTTAVNTVSEFIHSNQVVMYEEFGDGSRTTYRAKGGGQALDIPLVVLINEGTASASEITAGAIQDYGRGVLVGVQSYGKGSVQNWIPLTNDQGAVRVTTARWLTPNERQINKVGLTPDYIVEFTDEDIQAEIDPQLNKAIEILTTEK